MLRQSMDSAERSANSSAARATERSGERPNAPAVRGVCDLRIDGLRGIREGLPRHNDAFIAQEMAWRADVETERAKRSSTIPSPGLLAENRRLLTPATRTSDFGKAPLLDLGGIR